MPDEFDEVLYLRANPEVSELLERGTVASALDHWQTVGVIEHACGRRRSGFYDYDLVYDEDAYLRDNEDVAAAVRAGDYRDGYEHWIRFGRKEFAEGRRNGSFRAFASGTRPFRIAVGAFGEILAAPFSKPLPMIERLILRRGSSSVTLDPSSVSVTSEIELVDQKGKLTKQRLLLSWLPARLTSQNGRDPQGLILIAISDRGEVTTVNFGEIDQPPGFSGIDAARPFVQAARRLGTVSGVETALLAEVGNLVCSQLVEPLPYANQAYSRLHVEHCVVIEGLGLFACGWLIPTNPLLARCRAWCPETGECVEVTTALARMRRADVWEAFKDEIGATSGDQFGFSVLIPFPQASRLPECSLVLAITPRGGSEQVGLQVRAKPARSFVDSAKVVLATMSLAASDFEQRMSATIGPAVDALWTRERSRKNRALTVSEFGERPSAPHTSVVVPIYGRSDLIKYQLALFANDDDFRSNKIELIYFIDDPRLIDEVLQLGQGSEPLYRIPMVVAYTGENHGYSGANNLGASIARGKLLVLLNSDVMPKRSGWVADMARAYAELSGCGVLGVKLLYHDESLQHDGMVFERFPFWNGLYGNNHPGKGLPNRSELNAAAREAEGVTGACMMISRALYAELGGLSEQFVIGDFEDSELCLRIRHAGKRVYYLPSVELYHLERQSQSLLPDGDHWRWQLTVYNAWLQNRKWREQIDELKRAAPLARASGSFGP